ncbi:TIGR03618 family F420-dependent PPOX class oxidoreductase [Rhodococcoides kyotonense]|uniref:PPOX class probable F420-dependent enzyme n=1 Tax=Rhodococcoides kyotonense TaxID=398843 RepID=A0A239CK04_9NOCA|nr:TIGR03618 family F420-dependent PPOX class oxidoreductase [Rhodococcus kyotonensis]SNS20021.1 PPOX class probable F420-dependent enzyme [Rhodococcus kyotonensis]
MATTPADPTSLTPDALAFLTDRHLATLTTLRPDSTPHVVAVGFTWDPEERIVRIITGGRTQKALNAARGGYAAVSQVEGARWLTLEGPSDVLTDRDDVTEAERRYAERYRIPRENPERVVIRIAVQRILGSTSLISRPAEPSNRGVEG